MWLESQKVQILEGQLVKETDIADRRLDNCKELVSIKDSALVLSADKLALCEQRVALKTEESETYKRLYDSVRKKGICWKKVFTFGLGKCK